MIWSDKVYVGEGVEQMRTELRRDIDAGNVSKYKKEYALVLAFNPLNLLELIPVKELSLDYYRESKLFLLGLAADKAEATELVRRIMEDVFHAQGNTDVRAFFQNESA